MASEPEQIGEFVDTEITSGTGLTCTIAELFKVSEQEPNVMLLNTIETSDDGDGIVTIASPLEAIATVCVEAPLIV